MWRYLESRNETRSKEAKCNQNRFFGSIRRIRDIMRILPIERMERQITAIECDHVPSKKLAEPVQIKEPKVPEDVDDNDDVGPTDPKKVTADAKMLASSCRNAPGIAVMMLTGKDFDRIVWVIALVTEPLEQWHGKQNVDLKAVLDTREWFVRQTTGEFGLHIQEIMSSPSSVPIA